MKSNAIKPLAILAAALLAGCSSVPERNSLLEQARSDYASAQASPQVTSLAAVELKLAGDSLDRANNASRKRENDATVDHLAYVAKQHVAIARETARQKNAELMVASAAAERDRVRLAARTREADSAQRSAEHSQRQAEASRRSAEAAQRRSEASQRQSEASQRQSEEFRLQSEASQRQSEESRLQSEASQRHSEESRLQSEASQRQAAMERQAAADAQLGTLAARQQAEDAQARSRALEAQLLELQARKTDRGMVVTLGDVLFDTDRAQLKAGGIRNVERLADFVRLYPQRNVMIEGFTDSTGSGSRNQELSDERAGAVRTALLGMGIGSDRITSRGYGDAYPVAGNDTAAGRQMNRRVEIVVSDDSGNIVAR
jgi:outer membrane protein OmpA-like peptidoglycan-associated protein